MDLLRKGRIGWKIPELKHYSEANLDSIFVVGGFRLLKWSALVLSYRLTPCESF